MRALDLLLKFGSFLAMVLSVAVMMGWIDVPDSRTVAHIALLGASGAMWTISEIKP